MTSLITGGAGFIGSHVADHVEHAVVLDDLSGGFIENVPAHCKFIQGSICDEQLVDEIVQQYSIDVIYHFAAFAAEVYSPFVPKFTYHNNILGSVNLVSAAIKHKVRRFVFCSSIAVYGEKFPMEERILPTPRDPYGISKYAIELHLAAAQHQFGLEYTVFRPHNVYGERQNMGDATRNVVGIFMDQAMKGTALTIYGDGNQRRAFTYVHDIAKIMAKSAEDARFVNEVFNIGANAVYSVNQIAEVVTEALNTDVPRTFLAKRNEAVDAWANHDNLQRLVPHNETPLCKGIEQMAKWARLHGGQKLVARLEPEIANTRNAHDTTSV